ncbi:methylmalonyl Co-A mutase-associated GTPase MeaB [Arvimicrobium flavum]|uniref:methylmalonyl Co-A mutase-associated GTPase MeaB n=1 Tax=Arvimicrobium flavum TaxID=3393320 RepID=UPI00237C10AA|nr:methylmalonyl Co-A mutase-associated GTPase MeaB [Mesorhizobium shangrilense]
MEVLDLSGAGLVAAVLDGDRRAIARMLTVFDDAGPGSAEAASKLAAHAGRALVVGITGVPGAGKSTLVNALLGAWLERGHKVAVLAIDPSSPITGGAVLGDRIRMGEHGAHPDAFIRSFSARGELGGLSRATRAAVDCLDAAGFDRVIVETVGAGQSETAITAMADTRVVLCPPGLGDGIQAIKAGILEIADVLAISKGDLPFAEETAREMREMLTLRRTAPEQAWKTRVMLVSAPQKKGIAELIEAVEEHARISGHGQRLKTPALGASLAVPADPNDAEAWRARLAALAERDGLCSTLGISVIAGGPGRAEVTMTVDARHLNFNGGCHGGAIFALADAAFGLASNSHGVLASGINAHATFQVGVRPGEKLIARAHEYSRSKRIGVYRAEVVRQDSENKETPVSAFTGTVSIKQ